MLLHATYFAESQRHSQKLYVTFLNKDKEDQKLMMVPSHAWGKSLNNGGGNDLEIRIKYLIILAVIYFFCGVININ